MKALLVGEEEAEMEVKMGMEEGAHEVPEVWCSPYVQFASSPVGLQQSRLSMCKLPGPD